MCLLMYRVCSHASKRILTGETTLCHWHQFVSLNMLHFNFKANPIRIGCIFTLHSYEQFISTENLFICQYLINKPISVTADSFPFDHVTDIYNIHRVYSTLYVYRIYSNKRPGASTFISQISRLISQISCLKHQFSTKFVFLMMKKYILSI